MAKLLYKQVKFKLDYFIKATTITSLSLTLCVFSHDTYMANFSRICLERHFHLA